MNTLPVDKNQTLDDVSRYHVVALNNRELTRFNGGAVSGAAAIGIAVAGGLTAIAAGVLVGVGIYYGVKWLTS